MNNKPENDFDKYPEVPLGGRLKLSIKWFPEKIERLLDGGCSFGYGTRYFVKYAKETYGVEISKEHCDVGRKRFKEISFHNSGLEKTNFDNEFFDVIVLNDVLEHTSDRIQSLSEMYRILKKEGIIIISTPHKGLFGFLDPYNYGFYLKKYLKFIYNPLYKIIRLLKTGSFPKESNPEHGVMHYHYSLNDFKMMLNQSDFKENYIIDKVFRSGLILEPIYLNLERFLDIIVPLKLKNAILKPIYKVVEKEYWIPTGIFAFDIAIRVIKK